MTSKRPTDLPPDIAAVETEKDWLRHFRYAPRAASFTSVQWLILQLVACGLSDKEIAHLLEISPATVKAHHSKTMRSLDFIRRTQLVRYVFETGQFEPEAAERVLAERKRRRQRLSARRMLQGERPQVMDTVGTVADIR